MSLECLNKSPILCSVELYSYHWSLYSHNTITNKNKLSSKTRYGHNQQIEHKKFKFCMFQNFNYFTCIIYVKMSLSKHKSHNYATVQMNISSKLCIGSNPTGINVFQPFFSLPVICKTILVCLS